MLDSKFLRCFFVLLLPCSFGRECYLYFIYFMWYSIRIENLINRPCITYIGHNSLFIYRRRNLLFDSIERRMSRKRRIWRRIITASRWGKRLLIFSFDFWCVCYYFYWNILEHVHNRLYTFIQCLEKVTSE